jgi:hypothetical protein
MHEPDTPAAAARASASATTALGAERLHQDGGIKDGPPQQVALRTSVYKDM